MPVKEWDPRRATITRIGPLVGIIGNKKRKKKQMSKELTNEQKQLADQMIQDIVTEVENEAKVEAGETVTPVEAKPNALVDGVLEWGNQLNFDNVTDNSVLLVKINADEPQYSHAFQMGVIRHVLEPRAKLLKEKKITVLFMSDRDDLSILSENEMSQAGWEKKEKTRIIIPN